MAIYSFQRLTVWQDSRKLVLDVYRITNDFPKSELFVLTSQLRRAVISIGSNLAEGSTRTSLKEQGRFSEISLGSAMEVLNQLILAHDLGYINQNKLDQLMPQIDKISNKLIALIKSQKLKSIAK